MRVCGCVWAHARRLNEPRTRVNSACTHEKKNAQDVKVYLEGDWAMVIAWVGGLPEIVRSKTVPAKVRLRRHSAVYQWRQ